MPGPFILEQGITACTLRGVLLFTCFYLYALGGVEVVLFDEALYLAERFFEVQGRFLAVLENARINLHFSVGRYLYPYLFTGHGLSFQENGYAAGRFGLLRYLEIERQIFFYGHVGVYLGKPLGERVHDP